MSCTAWARLFYVEAFPQRKAAELTLIIMKLEVRAFAAVIDYMDRFINLKLLAGNYIPPDEYECRLQ
jgi:hypothetical protein